MLRALRPSTLRIVLPSLPKVGHRAKQVVWHQVLTPLERNWID
jgi:hypothetical protein